MLLAFSLSRAGVSGKGNDWNNLTGRGMWSGVQERKMTLSSFCHRWFKAQVLSRAHSWSRSLHTSLPRHRFQGEDLSFGSTKSVFCALFYLPRGLRFWFFIFRFSLGTKRFRGLNKGDAGTAGEKALLLNSAGSVPLTFTELQSGGDGAWRWRMKMWGFDRHSEPAIMGFRLYISLKYHQF